jgi:hypothetical protein
MLPKEKADELFRKMYEVRSVAASDITKHFAKQSALIAVDEIIKFMEMDDEYNECLYFANSKWVQYLIEVKQEIEKL